LGLSAIVEDRLTCTGGSRLHFLIRLKNRRSDCVDSLLSGSIRAVRSSVLSRRRRRLQLHFHPTKVERRHDRSAGEYPK
jgi:hypothetical protein